MEYIDAFNAIEESTNMFAKKLRDIMQEIAAVPSNEQKQARKPMNEGQHAPRRGFEDLYAQLTGAADKPSNTQSAKRTPNSP